MRSEPHLKHTSFEVHWPMGGRDVTITRPKVLLAIAGIIWRGRYTSKVPMLLVPGAAHRHIPTIGVTSYRHHPANGVAVVPASHRCRDHVMLAVYVIWTYASPPRSGHLQPRHCVTWNNIISGSRDNLGVRNTSPRSPHQEQGSATASSCRSRVHAMEVTWRLAYPATNEFNLEKEMWTYRNTEHSHQVHIDTG